MLLTIRTLMENLKSLACLVWAVDGGKYKKGVSIYKKEETCTIIILHPFDPCYADTLNPTVTHGEHGEHRPLKCSWFYLFCTIAVIL